MNRRGFLSGLAGVLGIAAVDPEELLWKPVKKIFVPAPPGLAFHKDAFKMATVGLPDPAAWHGLKVGDIITINGVNVVNPIEVKSGSALRQFRIEAETISNTIPGNSMLSMRHITEESLKILQENMKFVTFDSDYSLSLVETGGPKIGQVLNIRKPERMLDEWIES